MNLSTKALFIFCACLFIVWVGWISILAIGACTVAYIAVKYSIYKFRKKNGKLF